MEKKYTSYFIESMLSSTIRCTVILYTTKKGKNAQDRLIRDLPQKPAPSVKRETRKEIAPHRKGEQGNLNVSTLALCKGGKIPPLRI